jgi:hypothetical protein
MAATAPENPELSEDRARICCRCNAGRTNSISSVAGPPPWRGNRPAALLLTNGKSKTPVCEVTASLTSDSIAAFFMPRPAGQIAKGHPQTANCLGKLPWNIALGRETRAAIRANGNVFRLAPQTDQQLKKSEGQP